MSWNYRVTRERVEAEEGTTYEYAIREVYYRADGSVKAWSVEPVTARGDSWRGVVDDLALMGRYLNAHVLDLDTREWVHPRACR